MRDKCEDIDQLQLRWEDEKQELTDKVDQLSLQLSETERIKTNQISEHKNQSKIEIEVYRKQFNTNEESYSREMRRLKDKLRCKD